MVVQANYQKRSLGKQTLQAAIDLAKERGATSLSFNSRV